MSVEPAGARGVSGSHKSCVTTEAVAANQSELAPLRQGARPPSPRAPCRGTVRIIIESALTSARSAHARATGELRELEETITKLEGALALTRAGSDDDPTPTSGMTLHEAMRKVLQAEPMRMMHAPDLAAEIGRQRLYRRPNGRAIEPQQIYERTRNYPYLFERAGTFIKLNVCSG